MNRMRSFLIVMSGLCVLVGVVTMLSATVAEEANLEKTTPAFYQDVVLVEDQIV